jgi:tetratricopeptide (TPR) repeat protein
MIFARSGVPMSPRPRWLHRWFARWRPALAALFTVPAMLAAPPAAAQAATPEAAAAVANSALDGQLLYQLLIGEMALTSGNAGTAYDWILDAARRTRDETLFRRAVDIALQARAGEQALAATRAWRLARPESLDALRLQLQILLLLKHNDGLAEPLQALLVQTPAAERPGLIAALPRFLQRASDPRQMAGVLEEALKPYRDDAATRVPARVALGRVWLEARDADRAWALAQEAQALDPAAPGPALLAMELMRDKPAAEAMVLQYLDQPQAEPALRLGYVRLLTVAQRYADAVTQLEQAIRRQPEVAPPYLSLGALHLELKRPKEGEAALERYVELVQRQSAASTATTGSARICASLAASHCKAGISPCRSRRFPPRRATRSTPCVAPRAPSRTTRSPRAATASQPARPGREMASLRSPLPATTTCCLRCCR